MALNRNDVIAAGVDIVSELGGEALGVSLVARRLRIKPPSLYNHVTGNEDLHHAVAVEVYRLLSDSLTSGKQPSGEPAARALRRHCRAFRRFALRNPRLYVFSAATALDPSDPDCQAIIASVLAPFETALASLGCKGNQAQHALRGLRAAIHGFVSLELAGQFDTSPRSEASFEALLATLIGELEDRRT